MKLTPAVTLAKAWLEERYELALQGEYDASFPPSQLDHFAFGLNNLDRLYKTAASAMKTWKAKAAKRNAEEEAAEEKKDGCNVTTNDDSDASSSANTGVSMEMGGEI